MGIRKAFCYGHMTMEIIVKEPYLVCNECFHVFNTEKDLLLEAQKRDQEILNEYGMYAYIGEKGSDVLACPICNHDF